MFVHSALSEPHSHPSPLNSIPLPWSDWRWRISHATLGQFAVRSQLACAKDPPTRSDCAVWPKNECHVWTQPPFTTRRTPVKADVKRVWRWEFSSFAGLETREAWRPGARGKSREQRRRKGVSSNGTVIWPCLDAGDAEEKEMR